MLALNAIPRIATVSTVSSASSLPTIWAAIPSLMRKEVTIRSLNGTFSTRNQPSLNRHGPPTFGPGVGRFSLG